VEGMYKKRVIEELIKYKERKSLRKVHLRNYNKKFLGLVFG
jgi:hypothetical protein